MSGLQELVPDSQTALQHTTSLTTRLGNIEDFLRNPDNGTGDSITMDQILNSDTMDWSTDGYPTAGSQPSSRPQLQAAGNAPMPSAGTSSNIFNFGGPSYVPTAWNSRQPTHENHTRPAQAHITHNVHERQLLQARTQLASARTNEENQRHLVSLAVPSNQEQAQTTLRRAIEHREHSERLVAALENSQRQSAHIFGSREEIERQGNTYESPIGHMFNQYGNRYQAAEAQRRQEITTHERYPDVMARYVEQSTQISTDTPSEHVRTVEDIRQELQRESEVSHPSGSRQAREQQYSRRQPYHPRGAQQTAPTQTPQPHTATTYQTPYLSAYLRNNGAGSSHGQTLAALREHLTAVETTALSERSQARRAAVQREARTRTEAGQHNPFDLPPGPYSRRTQHPPAPADLPTDVTAMIIRQQESVATANFPGRAAAMERRLRLRREEYPGLYGSDEDDLSRSDIDRYIAMGVTRSRPEPEPPKSLDKDDGRPAPLDDEDMVVKMECKICFAQIATIALLPCGHCVMCKWCADEAVPSHKLDVTAPASRKATCPVCRKRVKQKATIYGGEAPEPKFKKMKEDIKSKTKAEPSGS
ncbi:hypothetical protein MMC30_001888 [Trapelia coarctata]|nr:hypothetical protein [Trapelia coarctata]